LVLALGKKQKNPISSLN